jgi:metallo-beta-lactamase family protein
MKIAFHGAARTVTGSKHVLTLDNGKKILLDCGLFQGMGSQTDELNNHLGFNPQTISYIFLSHAHIDHTGLIPKLVKEGFAGKIYATPATRDLSEILLYDSAEIQGYEAEFINKKRAANNQPMYEPLYDTEAVAKTMQLFEAVEYDRWTAVEEGLELMFTNTGHLIGSAAIHVKAGINGSATHLTFTGDVGRYRSVLLAPPVEFPQSDYVVIESTYGNQLHDVLRTPVDDLMTWVKTTCVDKQGQLIIPAFSVGRTQEILYALNQLSLEKRLPEIKCFVDSPLSQKATNVIKSYTQHFNEKLQKVLAIDEDPFDFPGLKYIETVDESKQLVDYKEPCVIISASGMADAGRVKHHIASTISNPNNTILFAGYCDKNSLGGQLLSGAKEVEIFGDAFVVSAEVAQLKSMSGHGDYHDLMSFLNCQDAEKVKKVFLVHGEYDTQKEFASKLSLRGFENVEIPGPHNEYELV